MSKKITNSQTKQLEFVLINDLDKNTKFTMSYTLKSSVPFFTDSHASLTSSNAIISFPKFEMKSRNVGQKKFNLEREQTHRPTCDMCHGRKKIKSVSIADNGRSTLLVQLQCTVRFA